MKKYGLLTLLIVLAVMMIGPKSFAADDAAKTFGAKCAMCHGSAGEGKGNFPALNNGEVQKMTDAQLADIIAKGKNGKASHAFEKKGLDQPTIKGLVGYIRTLKK
jgi:mono/diheme cytochrome c family protein